MYVSGGLSAPSPLRSRYRVTSRPRLFIPVSGRFPVTLVIPRGLGAGLSPQNQTIAQAAATGASTTAAILVAMGTIGGPVGAVIAGIASLGVALANAFAGCGNTCIEATQIANQVADILTQNLNTYLSAPVHYASMQAAAINNFNVAWQSIVQACSNPQLAAAGQRCISDRQRGSCQWKASPGGWNQAAGGSWSYTPWGPAGSGSACWNWFVGFLDPIANDPTVVPDPSPAAAASAGLLSDVGISPTTTIAGVPLSDLILPVGLILAAILFL